MASVEDVVPQPNSDDGDGDSDTDMLYFDLACALALLLVALVGAYMPWRFSAGGQRSLAYQLGALFSGGVMLSAGLVHLLADALEVMDEEIEDFPLGPFLCATGFLLTLIIDKLVTDYYDGKIKTPENQPEPLIQGEQTSDGLISEAPQPRLSIYTAVVLALGLCFHSILEGLALGTEDEIRSSIDLAVAIFAHKGLAAYALGACVLDAERNLKSYWSIMLTFSIMSPIGVMVGYAISTFSDSITTACFSALASGTFLYVALMEVIPNELSGNEQIPLKLFMLVLGFGLMSLIAIWA